MRRLRPADVEQVLQIDGVGFAGRHQGARGSRPDGLASGAGQKPRANPGPWKRPAPVLPAYPRPLAIPPAATTGMGLTASTMVGTSATVATVPQRACWSSQPCADDDVNAALHRGSRRLGRGRRSLHQPRRRASRAPPAADGSPQNSEMTDTGFEYTSNCCGNGRSGWRRRACALSSAKLVAQGRCARPATPAGFERAGVANGRQPVDYPPIRRLNYGHRYIEFIAQGSSHGNPAFSACRSSEISFGSRGGSVIRRPSLTPPARSSPSRSSCRPAPSPSPARDRAPCPAADVAVAVVGPFARGVGVMNDDPELGAMSGAPLQHRPGSCVGSCCRRRRPRPLGRATPTACPARRRRTRRRPPPYHPPGRLLPSGMRNAYFSSAKRMNSSPPPETMKVRYSFAEILAAARSSAGRPCRRTGDPSPGARPSQASPPRRAGTPPAPRRRPSRPGARPAVRLDAGAEGRRRAT